MIEIKESKKAFKEAFKTGANRFFFSPGRVEIIGNHTDHNLGQAIAACLDRGITAAVKKNNDDCIQITSVGYRPFTFYTDELEYDESEKGSTLALAKGVLRAMKDRGFKIGGFQAALMSDIQPGSGLSSSASIECLIAKIEDDLYNGGKMEPGVMAEICRYAENTYFGKPCGLLDQSAIAFGGINLLDFSSGSGVKCTPLKYEMQLRCVLVNTGSSHQGLDHLYAAIPQAMRHVATNLLGVNYLGQATAEQFMRSVSVPNLSVAEGAKLMAQHFYDECERVKAVQKALEINDTFTFLQKIRESQVSMAGFLHNTMIPGQYTHSPQQAVDLADKFAGKGAARMSGGGFAGSVLCYVYNSDIGKFIRALGSYYGIENVYEIKFLDHGPKEIK